MKKISILKKQILLLLISFIFVVSAKGQFVDNTPFKFTPQLKEQADQGDAKAMFRMGYLYYYGPEAELCPSSGIAVDAENAMKYLKGAADKGEPDAQYMYGNIYFFGVADLVDIDYKKAAYWYEKAVQGGNIDALPNLSKIYEANGQYTKAFDVTMLAAQKGNAIAQYNLSVIYNNGLMGVTKDGNECIKWLKKSVEQKYESALIDYAIFNLNGVHVPIDFQKGINLLYVASKRGSAKANFILGQCYEKGLGVKQDFNKGAYFYLLSMDKGTEESQVLPLLKECFEHGAYSAFAYNSFDSWLLNTKKNYLKVTQNHAKAKENTQAIDEIDIVSKDALHSRPKTFAVIIGNEHYQAVEGVPYANNDAKIFAKYCEHVLGIPKMNIRQYCDLSYAGLLTALDDIKEISKAFDDDINIIFYYAGHGIPDEGSKTSYLLPIDANGKNLNVCYKLSDLYTFLAALNAKSVVVLLDACFSGAKRGDGMVNSARGVAIKPKQEKPRGKMVVLSAASGSETAYPYNEKKHGLFTYFLLKKLQETQGETSLGELSEYVSKEVRKHSVLINGKVQTPNIFISNSVESDWQTSNLGE